MEKIKAIREALNLKQNDFAKQLDITQSYYSAMETGKKEPSNRITKMLFEKFQVSPEWYYNGNGNIFSSVGNIDGSNKGVNNRDINDEITRALSKRIDEIKSKFASKHIEGNNSKIDEVDIYVNASVMRDHYEDYNFRFYDYLKEHDPVLYKAVIGVKSLVGIERAISKINLEFSYLDRPFFHFAYQGKKEITYKEYFDFMTERLSSSEDKLKSLSSIINALTKIKEQLEQLPSR